MTCNCNQPKTDGPQRKGVVKFCDICDPCNEAKSDVRLCAFVVPTLEEGRYYRNSFIFVEEDDSVYYISDDRSEIPFGSRPKFIENFDPTDAAIHYKSTVVYDVKNKAGYVYDPEGNMVTIALTAAPFSSLTAGEGIIVTADGGNYTVAIDPTVVASEDDLNNVTLLVTNHTGQINALQDAQDSMAGDIETIEDEVTHISDLVDDANELAVEAKENAAAAQQTANDALSAVAEKQDALTAGANISIVNKVISATDTTYTPFTGATASTDGAYGLVPGPRAGDEAKFLKGDGTWSPATGGFDPATTFWGRIITNGAVTGDITMTDGNGLVNGRKRLGFDSLGYPTLADLDGNTSIALDGSGHISVVATEVDFGGGRLSDVAVPTNGSDAANKTYVDTAIASAGGATELTTADYDYPENNPDGIALWKLASGEYSANGVKIYYHTGSSNTLYDGRVFINSDSTYGTTRYIALQTNFADIVEGYTMIASGMKVQSGVVLDTHNVQNNLTSTATDLPLSANQGKVLNDKIGGDLSNLTTTGKSSLIAAINELTARVAALEGN